MKVLWWGRGGGGGGIPVTGWTPATQEFSQGNPISNLQAEAAAINIILRDVCKSGQIEDRELYVDLLENRFLNFISKMSRPGGYKEMSSILADQ
jgi:hypothetical protein